jgi:sugar phosphate isomerase/epimerase
MKYGAHVFVWKGTYGDDELAEILEKAAALGLSFLEVSVGDDLHFDAALLGRRARNAGIELALSPGGLWPMGCDISSDDPRERERGIEWHTKALVKAEECGAVAYAGAIYGHPGRVGPRPPSSGQKARIAAALHELAERGARGGVRLVLEPMSHFRTHIANRPDGDAFVRAARAFIEERFARARRAR